MKIQFSHNVVFPESDYDELVVSIGQKMVFANYSWAAPEIKSYLIDQVMSPDNGEKRVCLTAHDSKRVIGLLIFELSSWDTGHFGFPTAIIRLFHTCEKEGTFRSQVLEGLLKAFNAWCLNEKIKLVMVRMADGDVSLIQALEADGFRYIESWVANQFDLRAGAEIPVKGSQDLREATPEDLPWMLQFSKGAFATQRFHADERIGFEKAESVYQEWIKNSLTNPDHRILVLDGKSHPAAYIDTFEDPVMKKYSGISSAVWRMILVDPKKRGGGFGTQFLASAMQRHLNDGKQMILSGVSMRNRVSLNVHNRLGFKITLSCVSLHKWF